MAVVAVEIEVEGVAAAVVVVAVGLRLLQEVGSEQVVWRNQPVIQGPRSSLAAAEVSQDVSKTNCWRMADLSGS